MSYHPRRHGGASLSRLTVAPDNTPPPREVRLFLREAGRRIERFRREHLVSGFVPSDYASAYGTLSAIAAGTLLRGSLFCEWGSGFGVVACLAAMLDFDAWGIEIEEDLVDEAQQLADDFGLPVEFVRDSFIPSGSEGCFQDGEQFAWLTTHANLSHGGTAPETDDFDVIFAYPWPDEERVIESLFARHAREGAVLATYHGEEEIRLRRKERRRGRH